VSTLATPSAKSYERVTGRWVRDIEIASKKDWVVYYIKMVVGSPVPWLMSAFVALAFTARAGLEIASWSIALLTFFYIVADRFGKTREFRLFRVGSDAFLLGFVVAGIISALCCDTISDGLNTLGAVRWVFLLYAFAYCWELFPGLNRIFSLILTAACLACGYAIWQHFSGLDLIEGTALTNAPFSEHIYFVVRGFFGTPELLATLLAVLIPFPAAAFFLRDRRDEWWELAGPLALVLLFSLVVLWSYRPGLWIATICGIAVAMVMRTKNALAFLAVFIVASAIVVFAGYGSPAQLWRGVESVEAHRTEQQRAQINSQVQLWQSSTWFGVGARANSVANYDPSTGNVYFQILAELGVVGCAFYLVFILSFLLSTYRILQEIPSTHFWHRVLITGGLGSQIAFHIAGLYWSTLSETITTSFFVFILASVAYLSEHYGRGLVPDDASL
jgi:hypothetical protein